MITVKVSLTKPIFPSTKSDILPGPLVSPAPMASNYEPVDCDFTDELEYVCVQKIKVEIIHFDREQHRCANLGLIKDIYTDGKEEFLVLAGGEKIRLDRLHQIRILND